ncbi:GGDEF/EAL domain-containing response regulator [Rhodanobacter ginsengiterrae]|uniref:GGDEF/EAL domain-containing response regulator n=1 Tax=Rhodanobacter ginsengiterrae TaxID=2008451 RepID=UPI003CF809FD
MTPALLKHVLLVDDKEENLYYLEALFKGHGYAVTTAQHGAEALVKARASPPDVIISDLLMPVMDGYTLLRHWKMDARLASIPFIVYTATYTEAEDERLAMSLGADAFILKPAEPEAFLARVLAVEARIDAHPERGSPTAPEDEGALMKVYSETLIRKLEQKSLQLEETNRALQLDIEARIRTEEQLRLLNSAVMQSKEAILITDAQLDLPGPRIVFANAAFTRLTGYTPEEVIGKTPRILQGPGTDRQVIARLREQLGRGEMFDGEAVNYRKDGSAYDQEWQIAPIRDADGTVTHFVALQHDITERKRAADEQQQRGQELQRLTVELESERSRLLDAQAVAKLGSWETVLDTGTVTWSAENHRIFETDPATFRPTHEAFLALIPQDQRDLVDEAFKRSFDRPGSSSVEHRLDFPDRRVKYIEERWHVVFDQHGKPLSARGTSQDISQRKLAEIALQDSALRIERLNRVYTVLSQISALNTRIRDRDELLNEACRIAVHKGRFRMSMVCIAEPGSGRITPVASAGKSPVIMAAVQDLLSSGENAANTLVARVMRDKAPQIVHQMQGDPRVLLDELYAASGVGSLAALPLVVDNQAIGAIVLYAHDADFFQSEEMGLLLSDLAREVAFAIVHIDRQDRLDYLSYYDPLTGLANRTLFLERIAQMMRNNQEDGDRLALFLFDLERFNSINDTLGRDAGDALLHQVAQWMIDNSRDASLLARIGTDHFAFVLPKVAPGGNIAGLFEKTMERFLQHEFKLDGHVFRISAKAGIAVYPDDGEASDILFKHAEAALKAAKARGERYLFFNKAMTERTAVNLALENQLRRALDNNEFVLHYQPKLNLASGEITGAEALMRWNSPHSGLVPPDQFIPVLEQTGMIQEVGRWALRQVIRDYLEWCDAGRAAWRIAVNVSALQLRNRDFVDEIARLVSVDPRAADGLELEITESMLMEDIDHGIKAFQGVRALGVHITLDDFGTGFSSLSYLTRLPLDVLKIDRSFIHDMTLGPNGVSVVSNIIKLAHSLNLRVVAEGIETQEQARLLGILECDEVQGFLYCEPVPRDVLEEKFLPVPT